MIDPQRLAHELVREAERHRKRCEEMAGDWQGNLHYNTVADVLSSLAAALRRSGGYP